jgi:hypothetical protein
MISEYLLPALKTEFAGWEITFDVPPRPVATFPARQEAVGKVSIYDDGEEVTVDIEKITHGHFSQHDATLPNDEKAKMITKDVIEFLKALFSDRVVLFSAADNRYGGWTRLDLEGSPVGLSPSDRSFLWSRPYTT